VTSTPVKDAKERYLRRRELLQKAFHGIDLAFLVLNVANLLVLPSTTILRALTKNCIAKLVSKEHFQTLNPL